MKNLPLSLRSDSISLILSLIFLLSPLEETWAKTTIWVDAIKGNAFAVAKAKTWAVEAGEGLEDFSEVLTEEGTHLSMSDNLQHKYHLSGESHVKFLGRTLELRRGYLWLQSAGEGDQEYFVHTANSAITYRGKGEAIISFDNATSKSQILVITGHFSLSNLRSRDVVQLIPSGHFSFVDNHYNQGFPRAPTPIGQSSFKNILSLFSDVQPLNEADLGTGLASKRSSPKNRQGERGASRHVASAPNEGKAAKDIGKKWDQRGREGQIIFIRNHTDRSPASGPQQGKGAGLQLNVGQLLEEDLKKSQLVGGRGRMAKGSQVGRGTSSGTNVNVKIFGLQRNLQKKKMQEMESWSWKKKGPVELQEQILDPQGGRRTPASYGRTELLHQPVTAPKFKDSQEFEQSLREQQKAQTQHSEEVDQLIRDLQSIKQDYEE